MLRIQMLDQDKCQAGVLRNCTQQFFEGFETTCGSADADDRERVPAGGL
ncbi:MAG: hypothetical protein JO022_14825 [Acidobacteriaceae bacterium]|nr:hypothetical protein [Acidobacteriaceae bacterium]